MKDEVLAFIQKRFKNDCNWTTGNCYYFAVILKDRFPNGKIYYDVIYGHFIFEHNSWLYDWKGYVGIIGYLIEWDEFDRYDYLLKQRIIRDCIM